MKKEKNHKKLTLILAGGGIKGLSYFGFIDAITEAGIEIDTIGAYSGGTWTAAMVGLGKTHKDLIDIINVPWWKLVDLNVFRERSVLSNHKIEEFIEKAVGNSTFEDLKYKTVFFATDITHKKLAQFDKGSLSLAIRASMALSPIVSGKMIKKVEYIDGGFITGFPTTEMKKLGSRNLVVGLIPKMNYKMFPDFIFQRARYLELMYERLLELMMNEDPPDLTIETLVKDKGNLFSYKLIDYYYKEGLKAGEKWAPILKDKLGYSQ